MAVRAWGLVIRSSRLDTSTSTMVLRAYCIDSTENQPVSETPLFALIPEHTSLQILIRHSSPIITASLNLYSNLGLSPNLYSNF